MKTIINDFLIHLQSTGYSERTVADYRYNLRYFTDWLSSQCIETFDAVTEEHIRQYQNYLFHDFKPIRKKSLTLSYQVNLLKVLKPLFRWLVRTGRILSNPAIDLTMPKIPKRIPRDILNKREIRKLLSAPNTSTPEGFQDRLIFELLYGTGIRRSELLNLNTTDINLTNREILIRNGKGNKDRVVPITQKTTTQLAVWLNHHRGCILGKYESNSLLITYRKDRPGNSFIGNRIRKYLKQTKLKKQITTHSFRHTCATHLLKNNASIRVIQELLGHESLSSTQRYTKVDITDLKRVIDKRHPREEMDV